MAKVEKLITHINTCFYDYRIAQNILKDNSIYKGNPDDKQKTDAINDICKKITDSTMNAASLQDEKRYFHLAFSDYLEFKRAEEDKLIFKIDNVNGAYYVSTGLYCGVINLGERLPQLEIKTGYSDTFFKRILNFCCGIYADTNTSKNTTENESIYSLLIQYLFLISLRRVAAKTIPKKYVQQKDRGYDIRGNIDIEKYVSYDLISSDKKISFQYPERLEIQRIVDVLHAALKCCKINKRGSILPDLTSFESYLGELYSGIRPSRKIINNVQKEKCLSNSLYSDYKKPLEYAKILLNNNDINGGGNKKTSGVSGFLVDASFLWEMYLYNLLKLHLFNWEIQAQSEISFYENAFYSKKNYPDFILKNKETGRIFILDAKFKRMKYEGIDVDNEDIRQLHSYAYYFSLTEGDNFSGAALIYPSKIERPESVKHIDDMFGVKSSGCKFAVFSIKDPEADETMSENELTFIKEIEAFLG